ncbi:MAG TPA: glycosyltransferase [Actinospica sp.]|nr:glycosyltransferase [Actinospica sp.]
MTGPRTVLLDAAFTHLARLSDDTGLFEHACHATPRREHGYCVDDVARGLIVLCRQPGPHHHAESFDAITERYLAFIAHAQSADGRFHNRLGFDRAWQDEPGLGDWWGRALWALGTAATRSQLPWVRQRAHQAFESSARQRPPWPRAMAFAALGAAEILTAHPTDQNAIDLLADAAKMIGLREPGSPWPWPEDRLGYANAVFPEVLIAAGELLLDADAGYHGLELLEWLLATESGPGHLSPTGSGGWHPGRPRPGYDQQPLEAAALADACARAFEVSRDVRWLAGLERAVDWFLGRNDQNTPLYDLDSGGCYDGLHPQGSSLNKGAESTLALISTLQQALRFASHR